MRSTSCQNSFNREDNGTAHEPTWLFNILFKIQQDYTHSANVSIMYSPTLTSLSIFLQKNVSLLKSHFDTMLHCAKDSFFSSKVLLLSQNPVSDNILRSANDSCNKTPISHLRLIFMTKFRRD